MKVAAIQIESKLEPEINLKKIRTLMAKAVEQKAEAIFLPECFYSISDGLSATPYLIEVEPKNEHYKNIQSLARDFKVYLIGGSATTKVNGKILNRAYNFDPNGNELNHYDKIHLFKIDLSKHSSKKVSNEEAIYSKGHSLTQIKVGELNFGIAICFDLRFPEMFREYSKNGANVLSISAAFTVPTGKAHWHTLMRARAIENQSYVVASAQWGTHNDRTQTFGHSLIINPWGEVIAELPEGEGVIVADLDINLINEVRARMKVLL